MNIYLVYLHKKISTHSWFSLLQTGGSLFQIKGGDERTESHYINMNPMRRAICDSHFTGNITMLSVC